LIHLIDVILRSYRPKKTLFLAFDGPGPRAKIVTQRARRLNTAEEEASLKQKDSIPPVSSLQFTPGTDFMDDLKDDICAFVSSKVRDGQEYYVSASDKEGEAECKIFSHISSLPKVPNEKIMVVGNDGDFILFALRSPRAKDISLLRSNKFRVCELKINEIRESLVSSFPERKPELDDALINDFIFLNILQGNDYIPKLRWGSVLWDYYRELKRVEMKNEILYLEDKNEINGKFMEEVVRKMRTHFHNNQEPHHPKSILHNIMAKYAMVLPIHYEELKTPMSSNYRIQIKVGGEPLAIGEGLTAKIATKNAAVKAIEENLLLNLMKKRLTKEEGKEFEDAILVARTTNEVEDTPNQTEKFSEGLLWLMEYMKGNCVNYRYFYPFSAAPSIEYFASELPTLNFKLEKDSTLPQSPLEFLMAVMPVQGEAYIPKAFRPLMASPSPISDLYVKSSPWTLKTLEGNLHRLQEAILKVPKEQLSLKDLRKLHLQPTAKFTRPPDYIPKATRIQELPIPVVQSPEEVAKELEFFKQIKEILKLEKGVDMKAKRCFSTQKPSLRRGKLRIVPLRPLFRVPRII